MKKYRYLIGFVFFITLFSIFAYKYFFKNFEKDVVEDVKLEFSLKDFVLTHGTKDKKEFVLKAIKCAYFKDKDSFFL